MLLSLRQDENCSRHNTAAKAIPAILNLDVVFKFFMIFLSLSVCHYGGEKQNATPVLYFLNTLFIDTFTTLTDKTRL